MEEVYALEEGSFLKKYRGAGKKIIYVRLKIMEKWKNGKVKNETQEKRSAEFFIDGGFRILKRVNRRRAVIFY